MGNCKYILIDKLNALYPRGTDDANEDCQRSEIRLWLLEITSQHHCVIACSTNHQATRKGRKFTYQEGEERIDLVGGLSEVCRPQTSPSECMLIGVRVRWYVSYELIIL